MKSLVVALVSVLLPGLSHAQNEAPAQGPTFRTGVDVITVDVAAVDAQGRPIEDLLAPEFAVRIDGQPRRVVSAQRVSFKSAEQVKRAAPEPSESFFSTNITPPEGRLIVIAVDELNIGPGNVRPLLNVAAKFVENLGPADRVAFYAYPQPAAFVDFTGDHARIRRAMETVTGNQVPHFDGRFNLGLYEAVQVVLRNDERLFARVTARECPRSTVGDALDQCEQDVFAELSRVVAKIRDDRYASLQGLQQLLARLRVFDGQKSLIIISEGLIIEDPSNLDVVIRQAAAAQASVHVLMMDVVRGSVTRAVMSPTATEDRELQMDGLREMASASRGTLWNVFGNGEAIFNRLASELSAYYLLGVEADPRDRDDKPHRIDVEVRRRGVTLRSRKAFVLSSPRNTAPAERLSELLVSPFGVPEIPLRLTTYALQQGASGSKIRMLIAADVGQTGAAPGRYTMGWALIDREGRLAATGSRQQQLTTTPGHADAALTFSTDIAVEPGVYWLRFGVVDEAGRRGSVVREISAWKLNGETFAVSDLVVGRVPEGGSPVIASVEPHVNGDLAAVVELYSTTPSLLDQTRVTFEIADTEESAALVSVPAAVAAGGQTTSRTTHALIAARALPPGSYVARARITRDDKQVGLLVRPFVLHPATAAAASAVAPTAQLMFTPPPFDRSTTLAPGIVKELLDSVEKRTPALKGAVAAARAGRYGAASLEALDGDQSAAAFFKGLDLYTKGQLDEAANQFHIAAGPRREFFPAAFYLGAAFAAAGRDRDAASVWQIGIGDDPRPAIAYTLFADARFRDGQPQSVIDVLEPAWRRSPGDEQMARRLAFAYVMTGRYADAIPLLDAYLAKHADDQYALYAAIVAQYEVSSRAGVTLPEAEIAKLARYARAYRGPQQALIEKYVEALRAR